MGSTSSGAATSAPAYAGAFFRQAPVTIGAPPTVTVTNAQPGAPAPSGADAYLPAMQERLATVTREDAAKFVGLMFGKFEKFCNEEGVAVGGYPLTLFGNPTGLRVSVSTSGTSRIATLVLPPDTDAKGRPKLALALYKATEHKLQYGGLSDDYNVRAAIQAYIYSLARLDDESPRSRKPTKRLTAGDDGPYAREVVAKPVPVSATTERMGASEKSTSARKLSIELADGQWQVCCRASGCERLTEVKKADELTANRCSNARCATGARRSRRRSRRRSPPRRRAASRRVKRRRHASARARRTSDEEGDEEPPLARGWRGGAVAARGRNRPAGAQRGRCARGWRGVGRGRATRSSEIGPLIPSYWDAARQVWTPCRPKGGELQPLLGRRGRALVQGRLGQRARRTCSWVQYERDGEWHELTTRDVQRTGCSLYGGKAGAASWLELKLQHEMEREAKGRAAEAATSTTPRQRSAERRGQVREEDCLGGRGS